MAPEKAPAFQFYPKDFMAGTATMSLQEVGAYMRLLCYAWDAGSVPNDAGERARICGCSKAQERELWKKVGKKFYLEHDAYFNERLEEERKKQAEYRRRQSDKGRASAATRRQPSLNHGSTTVDSRLQPDGNSSSSSSSSRKDHNTNTARVNGHGNGANPPGSLPRDHRFHAVCGAHRRVCLTESTAAKLAAKWGGPLDEVASHLQRFSDGLELLIGEGPKGDWLWLEQHFEVFMANEGRVPVAAVKVKPVKVDGVMAAIDAWGRE